MRRGGIRVSGVARASTRSTVSEKSTQPPVAQGCTWHCTISHRERSYDGIRGHVLGHDRVSVLVDAGTNNFRRNSEKGIGIGMCFVSFACLTSESNGLTRSRARPSGQGKGKGIWVGLGSSSGIPNAVTNGQSVIAARGV